MLFNIILFEGTDKIRFGMTREEVKTVLRKEPHLFRKIEFDSYLTEDYRDICHVFYNKFGCVALEFYSPSQVFYNNIQLIGQERTKLETLFSNLEGYESKTDTISVFNNDFSLYIPHNYIESVYISCKGYSEEQSKFYAKAYDEKYKVNKANDDRNITVATKRRTMVEEKMRTLMNNLNIDETEKQVN